MKSKDFVSAVKQVVFCSAISSVMSLLQKPPGKKPQNDMLVLSDWYNRLSEEDKRRVMDVVSLTARHATFGMLAVLDGARQIEAAANRGALELRYRNKAQDELLNNPNEEPLHDLFNMELSSQQEDCVSLG